MRRRMLQLAFLALCPALFAQRSMNNEAVLKLVKAGLSDDLIITTVNSSPGIYDTSANGIIALKQGGASDKVVTAILSKSSSTAAALPAPAASMPRASTPAAAPSSDSTPDPSEGGTAVGSGTVAPGSRIVIAPMGGFETYFAAAVREKRVPITLTLDRASAQFFVVSANTEWQGFVYVDPQRMEPPPAQREGSKRALCSSMLKARMSSGLMKFIRAAMGR